MRPIVALAVAHFPPPVHGLAVAADAFTKVLTTAAETVGGRVIKVQLAASTARRSPRHLFERAVRGLAAVREVARHRRARPAVYLTCDSSLGLIATALLGATARLLRLDLYLHHHSYAYISVRRPGFAAALVLMGPEVTHLVGCEQMATDLRSRYPSVRRVQMVPIMYAVDPGGPRRDVVGRGADGPLVLGHLSNLCEEKGLGEVFETYREVRRAGMPVRLVLAGPPANPPAQRLLEGLLAEEPTTRYLGPVHGTERDDFFDQIDVFVFPSRYRHESFGLVVGEAMSRGVPVAAYGGACLTPELVDDRGLLVRPHDHFARAVARWLTEGGAEARQRRPEATELVASASRAAAQVAQGMVAAPS